jgi:bifunctional non-homologous end joining protein LigD
VRARINVLSEIPHEWERAIWRTESAREASAAEIVAAVKKQGLEGVIAKRRSSLYEQGRRSGAWVKMRINKGQELVIGGYIPTANNFDSLIVGYYEGGDLIYVARVPVRIEVRLLFVKDFLE